MLSFSEKKAIFDSYPELTVQPISMNRLNYHYEDSQVAKTVVVKNLHPKSHNVMIFAGYLPASETQSGYISAIDEDEKTIRLLVNEAMDYLQKLPNGFEEGYTEVWRDDRADELKLQHQNLAWVVIMTSGSVEAVFKTKEAAESYLKEEGFHFYQ